MSIIEEARSAFNKDDAIDLEDHEKLVAVMKRGQEDYEQPELDIINDSTKKFEKLETGHLLKDIQSLDHLVKMKAGFLPGEVDIVGWADTEIDASIEECASFEYHISSRAKTNAFESRGGIVKEISKLSPHSQINRSVYDLTGIAAIQPREWVGMEVWRWENDAYDKFVIASAPFFDEALFPTSNTFVRATMQFLISYEKLEPVGKLPRTKVTLCAQTNFAGHIPHSFINSRISSFLMRLSEMRIKFDKSLDIDEIGRTAFAGKMLEDQEHNSEETLQIENGLASHKAFTSLKNRKTVPSSSPLATLEIAYKEGNINPVGKISITVRASPEEILAYQWDLDARNSQAADTINKVIEEKNAHNKLISVTKLMVDNFVNHRRFFTRLLWKELNSINSNNKSYVFVTNPEIEADAADTPCSPQDRGRRLALRNTLRTNKLTAAQYQATMAITGHQKYATKVDCTMQLDVGGNDIERAKQFPNLNLNTSLNRLVHMKNYFQKLRTLALLDSNDGEAMGVAFNLQRTIERNKEGWIYKRGGKHVEQCVMIVIKEHTALRELTGLYPWFPSLMIGMLDNHIYMKPPPVLSKLLNLSHKEANITGLKLSKTLREKATADAGVDQWMLQHTAMVDMNRKHPFFIPMCIVIGRQKVVNALWVSVAPSK